MASTIPESEYFDVKVYTPDGMTQLEVHREEYLFHAFERAGIYSPRMCLQGWCLRCAAKLIEGQVDQTASRRFYEEDRKAGFVLLCTAKPRSDLVIATHAKKEMVDHRIEHKLPAPRG